MNIQNTIKLLLNGTQEGLKLEDLAKYGIVHEEITDTDDMRIVTRSIISEDKSLSKSITLYIPKDILEKQKQQETTNIIEDYDQKIREAVRDQDYLEAARLQKEKQQYLQS